MALKICVIGCGSHSSKVHGPSLRKYASEYPDTVLAACCDLDPEKAAKYKEAFGFERCYTDMYKMLETEKPDAVCVIVPERFICDTACTVMGLGFHVMLEKPPGLNPAENLRLINAAEKSGVINQVAFNRRSMPLINRLKEQIDEYASGTVQSLFYEFYRYNRKEPTFETTAIHGIDTARHIIGSDYKSVRFTYREMPELGSKVANIFMDCEFESGVYARLNFCPCTGVVLERFTVNALNDTFFLTTPIWDGFDTPGELTHVKAGKLVSRVSGLDVTLSQAMFETNGFYYEDRAFFENVRAGRKSKNDIRSTLQSVELEEAIEKRIAYWEKKA